MDDNNYDFEVALKDDNERLRVSVQTWRQRAMLAAGAFAVTSLIAAALAWS